MDFEWNDDERLLAETARRSGTASRFDANRYTASPTPWTRAGRRGSEAWRSEHRRRRLN
jgi:hypothetical protein